MDPMLVPESGGYVLPLVAGDDVSDIHLPGAAHSLQEGDQV